MKSTKLKKTIAAFVLGAFALSSVAVGGSAKVASAAANWDLSGTYVIDMEYEGTDYPHTVTLVQDESGNLSGSGSSGAYTWVVSPEMGSVEGDTFQFTAQYTATPDALGTVLIVDGTIEEDGSLSGTWSDNYQDGDREGTISSEAGVAEPIAEEAPENVQVTIVKYVDGEPANSDSANGTSFPMASTWVADSGSGSGNYSLDSENDYRAVTSPMASGADYSTNEVLDTDAVGASCDVEGTEYALEGYSYGNSLEDAEAMDPSLTPPALTDIAENKYIIVWNDDCSTEEPPVDEEETATVTIVKYVDGEPATAESADNTDFVMNAAWNDVTTVGGVGAGSGQYSLSETNETPYQAETVELADGSSYSTSEALNDNVGDSCEAGRPYALDGYSVGNTLEAAEDADVSETSPNFTNLTSDKYVIVWNDDCSTPDGGLGGEVEEGKGVLEVTSIETIDSSATANNTYEDGWEYLFHITVPTDETDLAMKFSDWVKTGEADEIIPVANNMRISSEQATNGPVTITAANTYSSELHMTEDLDPETDGLQVEVRVEVKIPSGTENGSYTTNYGVRSEPAE